MSFGSFTYPFLRLKSAMSHAHPSRGVPAASAPAVAGIHRLKFPVADLDASLAWYTSVMSAEHILALDRYRPNGQRFAAELKMPALGSVLLELRWAGPLEAWAGPVLITVDWIRRTRGRRGEQTPSRGEWRGERIWRSGPAGWTQKA
jgi:hypothetical protein